ncbi:MAG: mono/diheme cytochrome c family protein [Flavobacteriales bacterium]|jgi:mono/diheme cytochrome c family protein
MKALILLLIASIVTPISFLSNQDKIKFTPDSKISEFLFHLGEVKPSHYFEYSEEQVQRGKELIFTGKVSTPPNGERSKFISKFYNCTSCHNTQREDLNLSEINPDERLQYAADQQIPYLPGSTFWGIVNRETWYNDDYVKKYGELVEDARNSLEESIQLCAEVCAQGRILKEWELNSILAYFWSLELKMSDLDIDSNTIANLYELSNEEAILAIKSKYLQKSPANFGTVPSNKKKGYNLEGRPDLGKIIYQSSCQHCHRINGESDVVLDNYKTTFKWLQSNITSNNQLSLYEIIRKGTYSENGHKEYMPLYPQEKMSDQQIEDLRAYIELLAK